MACLQSAVKKGNKRGGEEKKLRLGDLVDKKVLVQIQNSYIDYLQSSAAIIDADGKYLLTLIASPYCRFLNHACLKHSPSILRRQNMVSKQYLCHHNCYNLSLNAMKIKHPCTKECHGGIMVLAAPIVVDGETVGCVNAGVSKPPTDDKKIKRIARKFNVDPQKLLKVAKRHTMRYDYLFKSTNQYILEEAEAIAEAYRRKSLEIQVKEMALKLELKNKVLNCIYQIVQELKKGLPLKKVLRKVVSGKVSSTEERKLIVEVAHLISQALKRRELERVLDETEERYRILLEHASDGIIVATQSGEITFFNKKAEEMLGYEAKEIKGKDAFSIMPPKYRTEEKKLIDNFLKTGVSQNIKRTYEAAALRKNDVEVPVEISFSAFKNAKNSYFVAILRDITKRKEAELKLRETRNFLENVIEYSMDGILVCDPMGNILSVNSAIESISGYKRSELINQHISFLAPKDREIRRELFKKQAGLFTDGVVYFEGIWEKKDATQIDVEQSVSIIKNDKGDSIAGVSIIRDITEKKSLEHQLLQSQKMETIGTLAGGIAHDFNNILGGILGYASFVKTLIKEENKIYKYIDTIEASAIRAADLTSQLLSFSRGGKYESKPLDINKTIKETLRILYSSIDKGISIKTVLNPQLLSVEGDANQIQQVFLNLFVNARDAMPGGGALQIETKNVYLDEAFCKTHLGAKLGQYVYIAISDTGIGINQETLDRIFEPFFSTKGREKGTGLGLSVVYGIIKNHGGYINVYSELGKGSIFKVYLPASPKPILEEKEAEISNVGGEESILVIDDEEVIRDLVKEGLEDLGYTVLAAENGEVGISMYGERKREIDLVILDLILPKISGKITYEKLKEIDPQIKVLLSSGYSQRGQAQELLNQGVQGFIQKPFRVKELAREIRALLDKGK